MFLFYDVLESPMEYVLLVYSKDMKMLQSK